MRKSLHPHEIDTAFECGWSVLENGKLMAAAVQAEYDVLVTTDKNIKFQHNINELKLSILVLPTTSWPKIKNSTALVLENLNKIPKNSLVEIQF